MEKLQSYQQLRKSNRFPFTHEREEEAISKALLTRMQTGDTRDLQNKRGVNFKEEPFRQQG